MRVVAENLSSEPTAEAIGVTADELAALEDEQTARRRDLVVCPLPPVTAGTVARVDAIRSGMASGLIAEEANRRWFEQGQPRG
jgi:hypothetical protein